ncbi:transglutaminase domain-containing protein [Ancylomarina longa]|uniref:Transglutaminase domain-containing protein n=1 Tax=Ancylomarina longa TaxID=2487017 RepID=A0A434AT76_9BACT|nr:transglutaminase domain-containing protein [Ancylomarina longa]RUT77631.1 transglutaminase domain-containing protein [Ancylomarina longa]
MRKIIIPLLCLCTYWGCSDVHFIKDPEFRTKLTQRFKERKEFAANRSAALFDVFNQDLSLEEREALQFLYAYMPLCDLADYNGNFFLKQVRSSFKAKESFKWGKTIPDDIFRHFVLPYRVNNENLDSARWVFLQELKPRLQNLSMKEAALEVNHWCHEKVNYAPTDIRTSGPLSLVRTSWGRCGEESTFTVTALRAVGIPARQVYTPRWAHCDDNHAWVEVWVDGKWFYMGACEPESNLNMGWFTEPARRAMLVHTKVFGVYSGSDKIVNQSDNFTEINVVGNYAKVKRIYVRVVDEKGNQTENAKVDFGLYNYAEFYPIASKNTNSKGLTNLTTGIGDLLVWASKNGNYAGKKISVQNTNTLTLELGKGYTGGEVSDLNLVPPVEPKPYVIDEQQKKQNDIRLANEDSIRIAYRTGFIDSVSAYQLAEERELNKQEVWSLLKKSQGNWKEIKSYLEESSEQYSKETIILLQTIAQKDLRDTQAKILLDHLNSTLNNYKVQDYKSKEIFYRYVLNPRIKNEGLIAYRRYLQQQFKGVFFGKRQERTIAIKNWIVDHIRIEGEENYYNLPITPKGVYELRISNQESRDIFFVALCRSLGIPARLEPALKTPQYFDGDKWINIDFEKQTKGQPAKGFLALELVDKKSSFDPNYYLHFSIGKLNNGVYQSLDLGWDKKLSDLPNPLELDEGKYRLITGMRGADGTVYAHLNHFEIKTGKTSKAELLFRNPKVASKVLGNISLDTELLNPLGKQIALSKLVKKQAIILLWLEPGKEPTRHLMEEFKDVVKSYEEWGGEIVIVQGDDINEERFSESFFEHMPSNYTVYKDRNNQLFDIAKSALGIQGKLEKPFILVLDSKGQIQFVSYGYKIGIHEHLLKVLNAI